MSVPEKNGGRKSVPPVTIEAVPSLELVTAAAAFSRLGHEYREQNPLYAHASEENRRWFSRIDGEITPFEQSDLDLVFSTVTTYILLLYQCIYGGYRNADSLISALREMDDQTYVDAYREVLAIDPSNGSWLQQELIEAALDADRSRETVPFADEAIMLIRLLSAPGQFRVKTADTLERFYRSHIEPENGKITTSMESSKAIMDRRIKDHPEDALNEISGGNYETLLADRPRIEILPVYSAAFERTMLLPDEAYIIIGTERLSWAVSPPEDEEAIRSTTEELLKIISDPTRLTILRLMKRRPRYGKELSDELDIAAPTISYHIDKLMQAGLVRLELSKGRRFYYSVNPVGIRRLQKNLEKEFLG